MTTYKSILAGACIVLGALSMSVPAGAAGDNSFNFQRQDWSFGGPMGRFDRGQLQRGYKVYKEVCAACHSMDLVKFRNLSEPGGPEIPVDQVKALAASFEIKDGPNDDGEMFDRPGIPADAFPSPFANEKEARAANAGAYPPDLSVIAKARSSHAKVPFYMAPVGWFRDIFTGYEESGADYVYGLLTEYKEKAPADVTMQEGMHFNAAYPGHQIAMAAPLSEEAVEYEDGTKPSVENYAKDVTAFLMWAAEPKMEQRKELGITVILFLLILSVLLYLTKKKVWSRLKH